MIRDEAWRAEKEALMETYRRSNRETERGGTVFCGSSLMERFPVEQWLEGNIRNRGIGGFTIDEYRQALDLCVFALEPAKIFINIGTNDMNEAGFSLSALIKNYEEMLKEIRERLPQTEIYVMSYYPVNDDTDDDFMKEELKVRTNEVIDRANAELEKMAVRLGLTYLDVSAPLKDAEGKLDKKYSLDGIHMNEEGYKRVLPAVAERL